MIREWIGRVIRHMFGKKTISDAIGRDVALSSTMQQLIDLWGSMYADQAEWLSDSVKSLNLAATVASELARSVTIEMSGQVSGSPRADYINGELQRVIERIRPAVEYAAAKGGVVFKPRPDPVAKQIVVDIVQAECFYPTEFYSTGEPKNAVFVETVKLGDYVYRRLECHELTGNKLRVSNTVYRGDADSLGSRSYLGAVPRWAELSEEVEIANLERPLFTYFRMPQANTSDPDSLLGASAYARAVDLIREADKQYSRLLWEFEGSELAIDVDSSLFARDKDGRLRLPGLNKRLFRNGGSGNADGFYQVFSPTIREQSIINGLNAILQRIEDVCGLSRGVISLPQQDAKTATELNIMKQRSYVTVADIQKALETALTEVADIMDVYATLYHFAPRGSYEVSFDWDDSIVVDASARQQILLQEVNAGLISKEYYLMQCYGVTEEQAKEMLPQEETISFSDINAGE